MSSLSIRDVWRYPSWWPLVWVLACARPAHADAPAGPTSVEQRVTEAVPGALTDYAWFHQNPELSEQELKTAEHLAQALTALGGTVQSGIGGQGLVAVLSGRKAGKGRVVLYRADMDALPVTEQTGLTYQSRVPGVMHACGHDVHMAVAVGAMRVMAALRDEWSGTVLFVAQPAEELGLGAARMLADEKFGQVLSQVGKPMLAVALHDSSDIAAGSVGLSGGYVSANVDSVDVTLYGKGGHGAKPHETVDPVVMAAEFVLQLQTIVSRRVDPQKPAVVTVGKIAAGSKHNIIASTAHLLLTVRSYDDETRRLLLSEIQHIAHSVAQSYHAPKSPTVVVRDGFTPAGLNDERWSGRLRQRFQALLGVEHVIDSPLTMGGEDFARFGRQLAIPGVMWRLGAVNPELFARSRPGELPGLHSDSWAPDVERAVPVGIRTVVAALLEGLSDG